MRSHDFATCEAAAVLRRLSQAEARMQNFFMWAKKLSRAPMRVGNALLSRCVCPARASGPESTQARADLPQFVFFCRFTTLFGFCPLNTYYSNNLPEEAIVDATSTAYLNSSSRSFSDASSDNVADENARAQSMATPRLFTRHSFEATGDAYSSIASTR